MTISIVNRLKAVSTHLETIENITGVSQREIQLKIASALEALQDKKIRAAFFGAFSDGKSTILAALTGDTTIKTAPGPTTSEVKKYQANGFEIVDTPGWGSEVSEHDDIIKKYISEAQVILIPVDPNNPIKPTQHDLYRWLLNDLQKDKSCLFILPMMEVLASLKDDKAFREAVSVKTTAIHQSLTLALGREVNPKVIGISADPKNKGLEYWQTQPEEYAKLSRISELRTAIMSFVQANEEMLIEGSAISVIRDSTFRLLDDLSAAAEVLRKETLMISAQLEEFNNSLAAYEQKISTSYSLTRKDILALRQRFMQDLNNTMDSSDLGEFYETHIGKDAYVFNETINQIITKHVQVLGSDKNKLSEKLEEIENFYNNREDDFLKKLSSVGQALVKNIKSVPAKQLSTGLLKGRDALKIPVKFAPGGALKLVKNVQIAGVIFEGLLVLGKLIESDLFQEKLQKTKSDIEDLFKSTLDELTEEFYISTYFPEVQERLEVKNSLLLQIEHTTSELKKLDQTAANLRKNLEA